MPREEIRFGSNPSSDRRTCRRLRRTPRDSSSRRASLCSFPNHLNSFLSLLLLVHTFSAMSQCLVRGSVNIDECVLLSNGPRRSQTGRRPRRVILRRLLRSGSSSFLTSSIREKPSPRPRCVISVQWSARVPAYAEQTVTVLHRLFVPPQLRPPSSSPAVLEARVPTRLVPLLVLAARLSWLAALVETASGFAISSPRMALALRVSRSTSKGSLVGRSVSRRA